MNNQVKVMLGSLIGVGVGAGISRAMGRSNAPALGIAAEPAEPKESFKERWERAKLAGDEARAQTEAQLRAHFRTRVDDPSALRDMPTT